MLLSLLSYALFFGLTTTVILADADLQRRRALERGEVDFADRRPTAYLVLALFFGSLPLIAYFGITRKSLVGWLMGLGAAVAVYLVVTIQTVEALLAVALVMR